MCNILLFGARFCNLFIKLNLKKTYPEIALHTLILLCLGFHCVFNLSFTNTKLKVSKSRKQVLVSSILLKNIRKCKKKKDPENPQDNFFPFFVRFLEELRIPEIAFEIYWPLVARSAELDMCLLMQIMSQ